MNPDLGLRQVIVSVSFFILVCPLKSLMLIVFYYEKIGATHVHVDETTNGESFLGEASKIKNDCFSLLKFV